MTVAGTARRWFQPEVAILRGGPAQARSLPTGAPQVCRSYSDPFAAVAWHWGPVGVDIERIEALDAAFCESICTPAERERMRGSGAEAVTSLWSSKEALAKALGDALAYDPRRLEAPMFWRDGSAGRWRARRLAVPAGYTGWLCWASAETAV